MKKILITGGTGLVGNGIQYILNKEDHNNQANEQWIFVGSKDANLTKIKEVNKLFNRYKPTHVIHLAAMVGGLYANMAQNLNFFRINMLINDNVLKCARDFKVKKVFSCLSTCIFSVNDEYPFTEKSSTTGCLDSSNEGYSWSKRMILILNKLYNESQDHCVFTSFIPCNIFGPHDNFKPGESHMIPSMIRRIYEAKRDHKPLTVYGDGTPKRQFIYSRDLGKLIIWFLRNYDEPTSIILSPSVEKEYTISEIVTKIAQIYNFNNEIIYDKNKISGQHKRTVCNKKLLQLVNDFEFTPFEQAITETINWFKENVVE